MNPITPHSSFRFSPAAWSITSMLFVAAMISTGCNSRAHQEVYRQRMASEIRVLEDQLYDADYQNRVLQDRLQKYNNQVKSSRIPTPDEIGTSPHSHHHAPVPSDDLIDPNPIDFHGGVPVPTPDPDVDNFEMDAPQLEPQPDPLDEGLETEEAFDPDDFNPGMFDTGETVAPEEIAIPKADPQSGNLKPDNFKSQLQDPKPLKEPGPLKDPGQMDFPDTLPNTKSPSRRPEFEILPPPAGISPPGKDDTQFDPIIPGNIGPPAAGSGDEKPPGQILLPDSTQNPTAVPEDLRIHQALSVGHRDGQKLDGATLVVTAMDRLGRSLNLNDFEVDAELSVVVLDPDRDPGDNRLGRWDFSRKEVAAMIAADKSGGFEIPIRFEDQTPATDKVIVHVRLRGDDQEMRTQANLDLRERTAASAWTPRGE
ncbi:hypothetical protein [Rubripirellula obstinata]|uniref:hypothetical protein n=1 Tax=Rubripirellula obstinata TaxID=406547 RepID=UPI00082E2906|nr:hypothetical protein [Rubripirellula obstinata]